MRAFKVFLIIIAAVVVAGIVIVTTSVIQGKVETNQTQEALDPFYTPPNPLVGNPGEIIRTEPIADYPITGATANRILYISKDPAGNLRARHERARGFVCTFAQRSDAINSTVHPDPH